MNTVDGKYLMLRGKPLVREKQQICYGDMNDKIRACARNNVY